MGIRGNTATLGGGRIIIIADHIILEGKNDKLLASGSPLAINRPTTDKVIKHGGSGGFIYLKAMHVKDRSAIEQGARI